ncbi:unnamed protein product, partial [Adineta steineri]
TRLCNHNEIFDPCEKLLKLTPFEKATLMSWLSDTNVDKGLNLYILLHYLSAINSNSYYYHYVNNGNSDGTNMFGHIIGTSGSGKSSALTPHMDALGRTLSQMDIKQEYIQHPNKSIDLLFEQPFIVSNSTALQVFRSLLYGNRLLCSTECDTLLSNLGAYGNQYNDPRFSENVNMLIQMFDGTKQQNRATLSTSYNIPDGRRASIIGASVGDPYARVSQQHYEANGISGAHNRFTHYSCPVMKAIKTNSGTNGVVSNMVPSLQHVYTVSFLLGKVEYVARQNVYDKSQKKKSSKCHILFLHKACLYFLKDVYNPDVEEKWNRLRPTSKRQYHYLSSKIEIELEEPEDDASYEHSKSAHYYMFNRVYQQWEEATETEQQEHEAIISFKNSAKIPRFICNFARFRLIMNILWHDDVYQFIEISETVELPYRVSDSFIEAVKNVMDQMFPSNLRKEDGTKILVIEKDTALMGDIFFGHVDYVSRQLFDLSSILEKFNTSPIPCRVLKSVQEKTQEKAQPTLEKVDFANRDILTIILSKFVFFSTSTFNSYRQFHNDKDRLVTAIEYLIDNELIYRSPNKFRFIKGTRSSYAMATPNQIKRSNLAHTALIKLNLNINEYEKLWKQCLLPTPELAGKIDKPAIDYISSQLVDYISIIHRLGDADDPVAQEILKPGLHSAQIGIDFNSNTFSLASEHILNFNTDDDVMKQLKKICIRPTNGKNDLLICTKSSMVDNHHYINTTDTLVMDLSQPDVMDLSQPDVMDLSQPDVMDISLLHVDVVEQLQTKLPPSSISKNMSSNETYEISILKSHGLFNEKAFSSIEYDYPISDSLNINNSDESFHNQQHPYQKLSCKLSSSIIVENNDDNGYKTTSTSAMDVDSNSQVSSDNETMPSAYTTTSDDSNKTSNETNIQPSKTFDIITLSKRLMLKPFIAFTKTDATRIYNNAET